MTKEQVIELAYRAGFQKFLKPIDRPEMICDPYAIDRLITLVRNAAVIEERMALADLCDAMGSPQIAEYLRAQAEIIRKEPTT